MKKNGQPFKVTFNSILARSRPETRERLEKNALLSNQMAKLAKGKSRRVAYTSKDGCLLALIAQGQADFVLDNNCPGRILSIRLRNGVRMHMPESRLP